MALINADKDYSKWNISISHIAEKSGDDFTDIFGSWRCNLNKPVISLISDDLLSYGNISPPKGIMDAVVDTVREGRNNGYAPSVGYQESREAVVEYLNNDGIDVEAKDVILCSGCSSAIEMCITVLADGSKNQNILMPRPGCKIYSTFSQSLGVEVRSYDLLPERNWEVNLYDLESKIDANTAAVIINNPSNPCGSVYTEPHLRGVLEICYRHRVPVIADENYSQLVFSDTKYTAISSLGTRVPILTCGGISKGFLVPGWRVGWIVISDPIGAFEQVRKGLISLSQRIIGCNTVIQGALVEVLRFNSHNFVEDLVTTLKENARNAFVILSEVPGLQPYMTQSTMYMMVKVDLDRFGFADAVGFVKALYEEESVMCYPGEAFSITGYIRIVITAPHEMLKDGLERITDFSHRHFK